MLETSVFQRFHRILLSSYLNSLLWGGISTLTILSISSRVIGLLRIPKFFDESFGDLSFLENNFTYSDS